MEKGVEAAQPGMELELAPGGKVYILRLYVAGMNPKSLQAIENIKRICEKYLPGR